MAKMEIANVVVNVGGDPGNQVPRYSVTTAEIALLRAIHGDEAVHDITPLGFIDRPHHEEYARLENIYGPHDTPSKLLKEMFPGMGARMPGGIVELRLDESFFAAIDRKKPTVAEAPVEADAPAEAPIEAAPVEEAETEFGTINDAHTIEAPKRRGKAAPPADIFAP